MRELFLSCAFWQQIVLLLTNVNEQCLRKPCPRTRESEWKNGSAMSEMWISRPRTLYMNRALFGYFCWTSPHRRYYNEPTNFLVDLCYASTLWWSLHLQHISYKILTRSAPARLRPQLVDFLHDFLLATDSIRLRPNSDSKSSHFE